MNAPAGQGAQPAEAQRRRGRFRHALSRRSLQADIIVIVISVVVLLGGLYYWQVYGTYTFPASYCGVNTSCHNNFRTESQCTSYVIENGFQGANCVRVSQYKTGFDAMIVGLGILVVSGIVGLVIVSTTKPPLETMVKTSL